MLKIPHAHKAAVSVITYDEENERFLTGGMCELVSNIFIGFDKKVKVWNLDGTTVFEIGGFR